MTFAMQSNKVPSNNINLSNSQILNSWFKFMVNWIYAYVTSYK